MVIFNILFPPIHLWRLEERERERSFIHLSTDDEIATSMNHSALDEFNDDLNHQAKIRKCLIRCTTLLPMASSETIIMQAKSLIQLSPAIHPLTVVLS